MKKLYIICFCLVTITYVQTVGAGVLMMGQTAAAVEDGGNFSLTGTSEGTEDFGAWAYSWVAQPVTPSVTGTMTSIVLRLGRDAGTHTTTMTVSLYSDSSDHPGTLIGTASGSINVSTFGTTEGDINFTGMSAAFSSGTKYWIVAKRNTVEGLGAQWFGLASPTLTNITTAGGALRSDDAGTNWISNTGRGLKLNATY